MPGQMQQLDARIRLLERRLARVEADHAAGHPGPPPPPSEHEPAPGTWDHRAQTARCRYCGDAIAGGTTAATGWGHCPARAAGRRPADEEG